MAHQIMTAQEFQFKSRISNPGYLLNSTLTFDTQSVGLTRQIFRFNKLPPSWIVRAKVLNKSFSKVTKANEKIIISMIILNLIKTTYVS